MTIYPMQMQLQKRHTIATAHETKFSASIPKIIIIPTDPPSFIVSLALISH